MHVATVKGSLLERGYIVVLLRFGSDSNVFLLQSLETLKVQATSDAAQAALDKQQAEETAAKLTEQIGSLQVKKCQCQPDFVSLGCDACSRAINLCTDVLPFQYLCGKLSSPYTYKPLNSFFNMNTACMEVARRLLCLMWNPCLKLCFRRCSSCAGNR